MLSTYLIICSHLLQPLFCQKVLPNPESGYWVMCSCCSVNATFERSHLRFENVDEWCQEVTAVRGGLPPPSTPPPWSLRCTVRGRETFLRDCTLEWPTTERERPRLAVPSDKLSADDSMSRSRRRRTAFPRRPQSLPLWQNTLQATLHICGHATVSTASCARVYVLVCVWGFFWFEKNQK